MLDQEYVVTALSEYCVFAGSCVSNISSREVTIKDFGISSCCSSSTSAQFSTKWNLIIVSRSRRNSVRVKRSARVCAREFGWGAAERRARGTFRSAFQAYTRSTDNCVIWGLCAHEY